MAATTNIAPLGPNTIGLNFVFKGCNITPLIPELQIRKVGLIFTNTNNQYFVNIPENTTLPKGQRFAIITKDARGIERRSAALQVPIDKIENLQVEVIVSGTTKALNLPFEYRKEIPVQMPKNLEVGKSYRLTLISSFDKIPTFSLERSYQLARQMIKEKRPGLAENYLKVTFKEEKQKKDASNSETKSSKVEVKQPLCERQQQLHSFLRSILPVLVTFETEKFKVALYAKTRISIDLPQETIERKIDACIATLGEKQSSKLADQLKEYVKASEGSEIEKTKTDEQKVMLASFEAISKQGLQNLMSAILRKAIPKNSMTDQAEKIIQQSSKKFASRCFKVAQEEGTENSDYAKIKKALSEFLQKNESDSETKEQ